LALRQAQGRWFLILFLRSGVGILNDFLVPLVTIGEREKKVGLHFVNPTILMLENPCIHLSLFVMYH